MSYGALLKLSVDYMRSPYAVPGNRQYFWVLEEYGSLEGQCINYEAQTQLEVELGVNLTEYISSMAITIIH